MTSRITCRAQLLDALEIERHQPIPAPGPMPWQRTLVASALNELAAARAHDEAADTRIRAIDVDVVHYARKLLQKGRPHHIVAELCDIPPRVVADIDRAGW